MEFWRNTRPLFFALCGAALLAVGYFAKYLGPIAPLGTVFFFSLAALSFSAFIPSLGCRIQKGRISDFLLSWGTRIFLVVFGLGFGIFLVEGWLWLADDLKLGKTAGQAIPEEWQKREITIPGAAHAHFWLGKLFVFDENGMRRTRPFPPPEPGKFRIAVLGDSLTYGYGVENNQTYCAVLQRILEKNYSVEVLNLGISGLSSEDIVEIARRFVPKLHPNLVFYGVCLNDYLPRGMAEDQPRIPFVNAKIQVFFASRTRLGHWLNLSYRDMLVGLGLRHDFFEDILSGGTTYRRRFAENLMTLNAIVRKEGLPRVVMMVLDQNPHLDGPGFELARDASEAGKAAGMEVIPIESWYRLHDGKNMRVNQWEGHPNATAHRLFAETIATYLEKRPELQAYRKSAGAR